jgi:hypothetical protein
MESDLAAAARVLGIDLAATPDEVRDAYRRQLLAHHPDVGGTNEEAVAITAAYRILSGVRPHPLVPPPPPAPVQVEGETLALEVPADEAYLLLLDAAHRVGDVTYIDRDAGLLEFVVDIASVVLSLQGRGNGTTEVFCTVEPLGTRPPRRCRRSWRRWSGSSSAPTVPPALGRGRGSAQ